MLILLILVQNDKSFPFLFIAKAFSFHATIRKIAISALKEIGIVVWKTFSAIYVGEFEQTNCFSIRREPNQLEMKEILL
jgi:hypothetical protein